MDVPFEILESVERYLQSTQYGLVLLFATDTFFVHLANDDKRVREFKKTQEESSELD